jgi:FG-GAP-like repeat/Abnormal spindle-like microcephaly-assoc'd, ASPM-SPD-2-Hydin
MNTAKKMNATTPPRLTLGSRRTLAHTALLLCFLVALASAQLLAQSAIPLVNQPLVPDTAIPGGAAFTLTVNGTNFASGAVVNWNGSARATTFISSTQVTAAILATDIAAAGTAEVTVTNPAPGGGTSEVVLFPVNKSTTGAPMTRNDITANTSAAAVATGDFRNDGNTDMAVANSSNSVDVFLGNGNGTFQTAVNYPLGSGFPVAIIAGDFNGDGKLDLAVLLGHTKKVAILEGNGDGTFTLLAQEPSTGNGPIALAAADVNNDGSLDLVVANYTDNTVSVLLGNGNGTFQTQQTYATGNGPEGVAIGDFNGDGLLDLAVPNNTDNTVSILLGAGSGTFPTHTDYATALAPTWVLTADFNGDGILDLAVCTASANMSVLLGQSGGTFAGAKEYKIGNNAQAAVVGDFNDDGHLDLATVNFADNTASMLLGLGNGTFKAEALYPTNTNPGWLAAGDFVGLGRLGLAVVDSSAGMLTVLTQTAVSVAPTILSFPGTEGGVASKPLTFTVTNGGKTAVGIASVAIQGAEAGDYSQTNTCGTSIPANKNCVVTVVFDPQGVGTRTAQIVVTTTTGSSLGVVASGLGIVTLSIGPNPHTYPTTLLNKQSAPFTATVKNSSGLTITFTSVGLTGFDTQDYVITQNNCGGNGSTLAPHTSCTILIAFKPTQTGQRTAAITVFGNFSPGNGQQAILLNGLGTAVLVQPTTLTFAAQTVGTTSPSQVVKVRNVNTTALPVTITIQGANPKDFAQTNNCNGSIPPATTCTITVTFTPLVTGPLSATVNIGDSDPTGPQVVTLTGTGQ